MKKIVNVFLILCSCIIINAQVSTITESSVFDVVDFVDTDKAFQCHSINFYKNVERLFVDSAAAALYIHLRAVKNKKGAVKNNGTLLNYNIEQHRTIWQSEVNFANSIIDHKNDLLFIQKPNKTQVIELGKGETIHDFRIHTAFVSFVKDCVIGYDAKIGQKLKALQSYDLTTGELLWEEDVDRRFGWREIHMLDSAHLLIVADGLIKLNIETGKSWSIQHQSGKVRFNLITTVNTFYNHNSNAVVEGDDVFYASSEALIKVQNDGLELWRMPLNPEKTGTSMLFSPPEDSIIYLLNSGYINTTNNPSKKYGTPYLLAVDKETGQKRYINWFINFGKIRYIGFLDHLVLFDGKKVKKMRIDQGVEVAEINLKRDRDQLVDLVKSSLHMIGAGEVQPIVQLDPELVWFIDKSTDVVGYGIDGNIKAKIEFEVLSKPLGDLGGGYRLFSTQHNNTLVVDDNNKIRAELKGSRPRIADGQLFLLHGEQINIIEIGDFIEALNDI